jgi:predicted  nucleic acid-binding Zn-ribbon protein
MTQNSLYQEAIALNADLVDLQSDTLSYGYTALHSETTNLARQLKNLRHRATRATTEIAKQNVEKELNSLRDTRDSIKRRLASLQDVITLNYNVEQLGVLAAERNQGGIKLKASRMKQDLAEILEAVKAGDEDFVKSQETKIGQIGIAYNKWRNELRELTNTSG